MRKNRVRRLPGIDSREGMTEGLGAGMPAPSQQDELRSIYQSITDGVLILGNDGFIHTVNPAAEAILGKSAASLIGTAQTGVGELDTLLARAELVPAANMVHCREEHDCGRQECPAWSGSDRRCWLTSGTICHDRIQGTFVHKRDACERCLVFRKNSTVSVSIPIGSAHFDATVAPVLDDRGQPKGRLAIFHDTTVEHQRATQMSLLYEISNTISMSADPQASLKRSLDLCIRAMGATSGSIMLVDDGWMSIAVQSGLSPEALADAGHRVGEGISGWVAEKGEPLLINSNGPASAFQGTRGLSDAICIPIRDEADVIGVLSLNEKKSGGGFRREDVDFLGPVAAQIGMALSRARLHEQIAREEQLKTAIVEGIGESLSVRGPDRVIIFANAVHRGIFGEDCVGRRCHEVYLGRDHPCSVCPLDQCFQTGQTIRYSPLVLDCLGARRHLEATISPVLDAEGNIISCIETSRDVSDLVQARDQAESRLETLSTLFDISRTLSSSLEIEHVTGELARQTLKALDAENVAIMLTERLDDGRLRLVMHNQAGATDGWEVKPGDVIDLGSINDAIAEEKWAPITFDDQQLGKTGLSPLAPSESRSVLVGRLASRKGLMGLMTASSARKDAFADPALVELFADITSQAAVAMDNAAVYRQLEQTLWNTIRSLAEAIDAKDSYTRGHSDRVADFAELLAEELGLDDEEISAVRYAGYLHDTGKIGIPDAVLNKAGRLTGEEYELIMSHPVLSHRIIEPVDFLSDIKPLVRHHHERYDGTGYPDGLAGESIPLGARVISVADAYEAMISDRPYRQAMSSSAAVDELRRCSGTQFDPYIVDVFIRLLETGALS